jgi:hypothetical protein
MAWGRLLRWVCLSSCGGAEGPPPYKIEKPLTSHGLSIGISRQIDPTPKGREGARAGGPRGGERGPETSQRTGGPNGEGERERRVEDQKINREPQRDARSCLGSNSESKLKSSEVFSNGLLHDALGSEYSELCDCSRDRQFRSGLLRGQVESESSQRPAHSPQQE